MDNLAGRPDASSVTHNELTKAGIDVIRSGLSKYSEVPTVYTGRLGAFTFERAWYYWIARGPMPLDMARRIYNDPIGAQDVRVAGHCGCPPPDEWALHGFVDLYHIDSAEGLRLFADVVRGLK